MKKWIAGIVLVLALQSASAEFTGVVVSVIDGDTVDVLADRRPAHAKPVRVRLNRIDAPERRQAYGSRARQTLGAAVFRKTVTVRENGKDQYGRILGTLYVGDQDINRLMVAQGAAWASRIRMEDSALLNVEARARNTGRGLWAGKNPIPPWEWRRKVKQRNNELTN